ncbi:MAG: selenium metabolism-associated LysR family transcriptional regulator [Eubacteriales bacterium]|nr:selenium metabolism-associated LysR family transcriptional regulator [Eubacteriales bacterium]MDY3332922.1 selenium metabolism-associated LysR family transcriptional regulator [Gallibacter sp.]
MDFKQIEAFINVIKYNSFSKAAAATFLTQPTISVHIRNLESELGVVLLDRQGKTVTPTSFGKMFYKYATEMISIRNRALDVFSDETDNPTGVLEIQTSSTPGQDFVPRMMKAFNDLYPSVHFTVEQSDSEQVRQNLLNGIGEIGFVGSLGSSELIYEPVFEDEPRLIVSNNRPAGKIEGDVISIADFINEPFLWREQGSAWREVSHSKESFLSFLQENGYKAENLNIIARINSIGVIRKAVATGLGVSVVSNSTMGEKDYEMGIKSYKIKEYKRDRTFYLAYRKKIYLSPVAEAFKNFVINNHHIIK